MNSTNRCRSGHSRPNDLHAPLLAAKSLLIRQAIPAFKPPVTIAAIKKLARRDDVESRLIWREDRRMADGAMAPSRACAQGRTRPDWTLLVQSVDLH